MLPAPRRDLGAAPRCRPVAVLAAARPSPWPRPTSSSGPSASPAALAPVALLAALGVFLVACAGHPAAPTPLTPSVAARPAVPAAPSSSSGLPPAPPSPPNAPSTAELPAEPPPADGAPGLGTGLGGGGIAWGCGIGINGTCGFHLFLARHNKAEASEECLAWRRRALLQQHAPAGLASIERVRVGPGMDETAVRAALEPAVGQALGCYEEALRIRPNLQGRLAVRLTLDAQGCVTHAVDAGSTLANPSTLRCAMYSFISASLPVPSAAPATPTAITLTVALSPDPSREQALLER